MPIYEYVCTGCDTRFEKLVKRWGEPVTCPSCQGDRVDKQLSSFAVGSPSSASTFSSCGREDGGCGAPACGGGACGLPS